MEEKKNLENLYFNGVIKEYDILEIFIYNLSKAFIVNTHDLWM